MSVAQTPCTARILPSLPLSTSFLQFSAYGFCVIRKVSSCTFRWRSIFRNARSAGAAQRGSSPRRPSPQPRDSVRSQCRLRRASRRVRECQPASSASRAVRGLHLESMRSSAVRQSELHFCRTRGSTDSKDGAVDLDLACPSCFEHFVDRLVQCQPLVRGELLACRGRVDDAGEVDPRLVQRMLGMPLADEAYRCSSSGLQEQLRR